MVKRSALLANSSDYPNPNWRWAGFGVRFIVDLEAGKPTVRLETVMRVIEALGEQVMLDGLPNITEAPYKVARSRLSIRRAPLGLLTPDHILYTAYAR